MRRIGEMNGKAARSAFAALGERLALLAVALALIAQTLAFGAHPARADPRSAAAALSRIVGSPVVLCVQDDGAPADSNTCHNACPLCRLANQTLALAPPETPVDLVPPPPLGADQPLVLADSRPQTEPIGLPFARGPPRSL